MTTQKICARAPSRELVTWHSIDWAKCHREVRKLQARIVKATREGKYGKVKCLQWLKRQCNGLNNCSVGI